jgi:hypothetical protein
MSVGSQLRVSRHTCKRCRFLSCWFAFGVRNACIVSFEAVQTGINLSSSCPHQSALTIRKKTSLLPCQRIRLVWRAPTAQLASAHHCSGRVASSPRPPPEPACSSFRAQAESAPRQHWPAPVAATCSLLSPPRPAPRPADCQRRGGLRQDPGRVLSLSTSPRSRPLPPLATSSPRSRPSRAPWPQVLTGGAGGASLLLAFALSLS